jgi:hypothetical protein
LSSVQVSNYNDVPSSKRIFSKSENVSQRVSMLLILEFSFYGV